MKHIQLSIASSSWMHCDALIQMSKVVLGLYNMYLFSYNSKIAYTTIGYFPIIPRLFTGVIIVISDYQLGYSLLS